MEIRTITDEAVEHFRSWLNRNRDRDNQEPLPVDLLEDQSHTGKLSKTLKIEDDRSFENSLELAEHLHRKLAALDKSEWLDNVGLWTWLALFYFDHICPKDEDGKRKIGETARYILETGYSRYYRHLIYGPFFLYEHHGEHARVFLYNAPNKMNDIIEQTASRQEIIVNPDVIKVMDRLYYDESAGKPKTNAAGRNGESGSIRRLVTVHQQLERTYDLQGMNAEQIMELLPSEFDQWK